MGFGETYHLCMRMMEEYNPLDRVYKAAAIFNGEFLAERKGNDLIVQLYSASSFYWEVYYDPLTNKVLRQQAFIFQPAGNKYCLLPKEP